MDAAPNGCIRLCCADFTLSHDYPTLVDELARGVVDDHDIKQREVVVPMLIPLPDQGDGMYHYTCRHWDTVTGECGIYQDRPEICREYGGNCQVPGCRFA